MDYQYSIHKYPSSCWLLFQSKPRSPIIHGGTKTIIFTLLSGNILITNYHHSLKTTIIGLDRNAPGIT